ncbi:hypothetical protein H261_01472 [Paramagnetospirillum caucaseum]|uniref:Lipoprotein n=1 Tax=Paramagnetospirillum caucaseum TaxID=1244869 RepID=M2ZWS9_9PROT|nr:hypothetical protein [Paramagnetospirillum caucaseum]EME71877.1 hypothetical protein H261_01472 [Paramagnetospirillum caucaseum]
MRIVLAALLVAGCASMVVGPSSEVGIATQPAGARCALSGADGFAAEITTPAVLQLPHKAAPITVACTAPGYRRTVNTLNAGGSGWLWANTAFIAFTGGAAVLGMVVDEAVGASTSYRKDFSMELDAEAVRRIRATQRNGGPALDLSAP